MQFKRERRRGENRSVRLKPATSIFVPCLVEHHGFATKPEPDATLAVLLLAFADPTAPAKLHCSFSPASATAGPSHLDTRNCQPLRNRRWYRCVGQGGGT